jgi:hypothetical protein
VPTDTPIPTDELARRLDAIVARLRTLRPAEVHAIGAAVIAAGRARSWASDEAFWLVRTWEVRPTRAEDAALRRMWDELYPAVAFALGEDVDLPVESPRGFLARLRMPPSRTSRATDAIEHLAGSEGHAGALGIWNAACAALLADRLPSDRAASLAAMWHAAGLDPLDVIEAS